MKTEKLDGQGRCGIPGGNAPLFQGDHLQGLSAGGTGGHVGIKQADQRHQHTGAHADAQVLVAKEHIGGHGFEKNEYTEGDHRQGQVSGIGADHGAPRVVYIAVRGADDQHRSDRSHDQEGVEQIASGFLAHLLQVGFPLCRDLTGRRPRQPYASLNDHSTINRVN